MSQATDTPAEQQDSEPEYKYIYAANSYGDADTRHEAIGKAAKFGEWENRKIVAVREDCLLRLHDQPVHLGNKHYGDRRYLATTHGATSIDSESLVRNWNGNPQETVESKWIIDCPVCYRTHESDEATEEARGDLVEEVLDCCGIEWFPPSDWMETCSVCGESHREMHECTAPSRRDPFPDLSKPAECMNCEWDVEKAEDIPVHDGSCPDCGSYAIKIGNGH